MTQAAEGFNGWKNWETHTLSVHIANDEGAYDDATEAAERLVAEALDATYMDTDAEDIRTTAALELAEYLEGAYGTVPDGISGMFADLLAGSLGGVDWDEIAAGYVAEVPLFAAGWNMPGCLCDNAPCLFTSFESARDYIAEELGRNANDAGGIAADGTDWEAAEFEAYAQRAAFSGQYGSWVYWVTAV